MSSEGGRRFALVARLLDGDDHAPAVLLNRVCELGPGWCGVSAISVSLFNDHGPGLVLCSSSPAARGLEGMQSTLGEGPGMAAHGVGSAVLVPDVAASTQWLQYSASAVEAGTLAVFAFALQVSAGRFGAMTLYRDRVGALGADELGDAIALSEVVTSLVLTLKADGDGWDGAELDDFDAGWPLIHQATGMVSAQIGLGVDAALARLRAHAYMSGRSLGVVAADVMARRTRLEPD